MKLTDNRVVDNENNNQHLLKCLEWSYSLCQHLL